MNVLFEEQDEFVVEYAADAILPESVYEGITLHHEDFALQEMRSAIEMVGGKVHGEGHHV